MSKRKTYTNEFKTMIVELSYQVKRKSPIEIEGKTTNLEGINKMKKENAKLKEKNEILKKAMAIFIKK